MSERDHLPALTPEALELVRYQLANLNVSDAAKRQLMAMLLAAADPDAESLENVIAALPDERRAEVDAATGALKATFTDIEARGSAALLALSDDDWNALIDEGD